MARPSAAVARIARSPPDAASSGPPVQKGICHAETYRHEHCGRGLVGHDGLRGLGAEGHPLGHAAGRHLRPQGDGRAGQPSEQGDAAIPHLGAADRRRHRHRQGLRHQGARRLLRLRRRLPRACDRHRPLQGLQGARSAHADAVVLVEHHRGRPRDPRAQQGQDQEMGRPHRQARVHRAAAVRHPRPDRARLDGARREVHLRAGRSGDGRLAARIRRDRRHEHLHRLGKRAAAVAGRSLARRRLGRAQSEPGRNRRAEEEGLAPSSR